LARIKRKNLLKPTEIIGAKSLILGEVGSGKTSLIAKIVQKLLLVIEPKEITIIDMAPEAIGEIGGKISKYLSLNSELKHLSPAKVYAPRAMGTTHTQVLEYAKRNKNALEPLLDEFLKKPTKVLVINDVTLYLHLGKLEKIINCMKLTETFLASAYYGVKLEEDYGAGISAREKRMVEKLATYVDHVVKLNSSA
jgi:hypothetical protein